MIRCCLELHLFSLPGHYLSSHYFSPVIAFRSRLFRSLLAEKGLEKGAGARNSQRLPFSSDSHSPAPSILQRLPFSSDFHSPATPILQRLPFSSAAHSPATTFL